MKDKKLINSMPKGAVNFSSHSDTVNFPISIHELGFILLLREFEWGDMKIQKMDGEVRRVETSQSVLIDDKLLLEKLAGDESGLSPEEARAVISQLNLVK